MTPPTYSIHHPLQSPHQNPARGRSHLPTPPRSRHFPFHCSLYTQRHSNSHGHGATRLGRPPSRARSRHPRRHRAQRFTERGRCREHRTGIEAKGEFSLQYADGQWESGVKRCSYAAVDGFIRCTLSFVFSMGTRAIQEQRKDWENQLDRLGRRLSFIHHCVSTVSQRKHKVLHNSLKSSIACAKSFRRKPIRDNV